MLKDKDKRLILAMADNGMKWRAAAREIGMHRNSAAYRLDKIFDNTGLDPRNFYDLHELVQMAEEAEIEQA